MRNRGQLGSGTLKTLRILLRLAAALALAVLLLAVLVLRDDPGPPAGPPLPADTARVRYVFAQLLYALRNPEKQTQLLLTQRQLDAASRLLAHGTQSARGLARIGKDGLAGAVWIETPLPWRWRYLPVRARLAPGDGLTLADVRIGALPLPGGLVEWIADRALAWRFPDVARPLDSMILKARIERTHTMRFVVQAPPGAEAPLRQSLSDTLFGVDRTRVAELAPVIESAAVAHDGAVPMDVLTRAVFREVLEREANGGDVVADSRAAWVALAIVTVDRRMSRLIEGVPLSDPTVLPQPRQATLARRQDLAKHFALSGALTVMFADKLSKAAGEWKELNDSMPGGSGFSFVDLAADRAGVRLAASADTPDAALAIAVALAHADEQALFGIDAPETFVEGLSSDQFAKGYGDIDSAAYDDAIAAIDSALETLPLYRLTRRPAQ